MERFTPISVEYVRVPVSATEDGATVDPTSDTVTMAIIEAGATISSGDFDTADWEESGTTYYARQLIDFAATLTALTLTAPCYLDVYVKVTDTPEVPVKPAGTIEVR